MKHFMGIALFCAGHILQQNQEHNAPNSAHAQIEEPEITLEIESRSNPKKLVRRDSGRSTTDDSEDDDSSSSDEEEEEEEAK